MSGENSQPKGESVKKEIISLTVTSEGKERIDRITNSIFGGNRSQATEDLFAYFETFIVKNPELFNDRLLLIERKRALVEHSRKMEKQRLLDETRKAERKARMKEEQKVRDKRVLENTAKMAKKLDYSAMEGRGQM